MKLLVASEGDAKKRGNSNRVVKAEVFGCKIDEEPHMVRSQGINAYSNAFFWALLQAVAL